MNILAPANFSLDELYRYSLSRQLSPLSDGPKIAHFIGVNPSVANRKDNDPTVRRELGFCRLLGFDVYIKTNAYDLVATNPDDLKRSEHRFTSLCMEAIRTAALRADTTILAWGAFPVFRERFRQIVDELTCMEITPMCLGLTRDGYPRHPLYLGYSAKLQPYPCSVNEGSPE